MKKNEKLASAFTAADEELFAAAENAAFTPSADFDRRVGELIRKKNSKTHIFMNTTAKKVAAAALALVIVAAAAILVPAFTKAPAAETSGTEASAPDVSLTSAPDDENIIYRSESGDLVVRSAEPLEVPAAIDYCWMPLTEDMLSGAAEVFIGTIEKVEEIEITREYMGRPLTGHMSLLTVSADETVKGTGEISEGDTVKLICGASTRFPIEGGAIPAEGKRYAFFLNKSSEIKNKVDLSPIAEYTYCIPGFAFIPLDKPQAAQLGAFIGAEEGAYGEAFAAVLQSYYNGADGNDWKITAVRKVEPLDTPYTAEICYLPLTEETLNGSSEVFVGTVEKVEEIEITYELKGRTLTNYRSLLTVSADDMIKSDGGVSEGTSVSLLFGLSTRFTDKDGTFPVKGKQYAFFLRKTSENTGGLDYSGIADYVYNLPGNTLIPADKPQAANLMFLIGAETGAYGKSFISSLRTYYNGFGGNGRINAAVEYIEPLDDPHTVVFQWKPMDDVTFKEGVTTVFTGTVTDVREISMSYNYMDQDVVDYWSLLTVNVKDAIKGDKPESDTVTVLFEISSHRYYSCACNDDITVEKGGEYVFYLIKTDESEGILNYTPIADYIYHVPGTCFVQVTQPQLPELLGLIGAEEGTCGEAFVEALRKYYE